MPQPGEIRFADSLEDAASLLAADPEMVPMAGATWLMRADLRHEARPASYLALSRIKALRQIEMGAHEVSIGAMATHAQIAEALTGDTPPRGLHTAADVSANPGVRRLATLGGNICADGFAAADLVPALLALSADIEVMRAGKTQRMPLADFLLAPTGGSRGLLTRAIIARDAGDSAHMRLTMRAAGDYPVAVISAWASGDMQTLRIALGAVEAKPRRWRDLEQALMTECAGALPDPAHAEEIAKMHLQGISGRDAVDAKGAYRLRVLPHLVGRAFAALAQHRGGTA
ncbi:MAG: FAD binding domain-containing protein [Roseovarius sp.]